MCLCASVQMYTTTGRRIYCCDNYYSCSSLVSLIVILVVLNYHRKLPPMTLTTAFYMREWMLFIIYTHTHTLIYYIHIHTYIQSKEITNESLSLGEWDRERERKRKSVIKSISAVFAWKYTLVLLNKHNEHILLQLLTGTIMAYNTIYLNVRVHSYAEFPTMQLLL